MDLLDFDAYELYYEQEDTPEVEQLIQQAGGDYEHGAAELPLLQAYLRAPESLNVLVSLNRFYYYQHRLEEALLISEKALEIIRKKLDFPVDWRLLQDEHIQSTPKQYLTWVRLYLFTLKSVGFLKMRLYELEASRDIFTKLTMLDGEDRIGAGGLLALINRKLEEERQNQQQDECLAL